MCLRKTGQYESLWKFAGSIYAEGGFKAFYRGYFANLAGIIPYAGIELATYDRLRTLYVAHFMPIEKSENSNRHPPFYVSPLIASFAATIGIVITYPAALVRAKLQANTHWGNSRKSFTAIELLQKIIIEDGFRGLYRGLGTNMIKVLPAGAISYGTYEAIRKEFGLGPLGS